MIAGNQDGPCQIFLRATQAHQLAKNAHRGPYITGTRTPEN